MAIRRQAEISTRVELLASLLHEIAKRPELASRERFVGQYKWGMQHVGDKEFDNFAGVGGGHIRTSLLLKDLQRIDDAAKVAKTYVDRHIAHTDKQRRPNDIPTELSIDEAVDTLGDLLRRYVLLFDQANRDPIAPVILYDWTAPFRLAWIPPAATETT